MKTALMMQMKIEIQSSKCYSFFNLKAIEIFEKSIVLCYNTFIRIVVKGEDMLRSDF